MKDRLKALIDQALPDILAELKSRDLDSGPIPYEVELPKVKAHGDVSINLAFHLSRRLKRSPYDIARQCKQVLDRRIKADPQALQWIKAITVEKPGFINFQLTHLSIASALLEINRCDGQYGTSDFGRTRKVLLEFVSANPTGPLTIAHGRQAAIGDTLARILKAVGFTPHKEFYLNDTGRQIELLGQSVWARYRELMGEPATIPEEGYQGAYVIDLAKSLRSEKGDTLLKESVEKSLKYVTQYAVDSILREIRKDLAQTGVSFDEYFSEHSLAERNLIDPTLELLRKRKHVYEAEGALWFRSTQFGDDKDRVLKKQTGEYTYLMPDIAYHESKVQRGYERLINLWGPDHHGYIPRMKAAWQALGHPPEQLEILIVQLTTLYRKGEPIPMSTRKGSFVTLKELVDEVGADAARFFFLMRKVESHLDFDLELAKEKSEENPVYYVQYAHARISSILAFAKRKVTADVNLSLLSETETLELIKKMAEYPEVLKQAAEHLEPYRVVDYLRELAASFHKFYTLHRVVSDDEALTKARLLVTDGARIVLRNGLSVLGVSAPTSM